MQRRTLQLPGEPPTEGTANIASRIRKLALAGQSTPADALNHWKPSASVIDALAQLDAEAYYLLYESPSNTHKTSISRASKEETLQFMEQKIFPERSEGIDLLVCPNNFSGAIICNHDGDIFIARMDS